MDPIREDFGIHARMRRVQRDHQLEHPRPKESYGLDRYLSPRVVFNGKTVQEYEDSSEDERGDTDREDSDAESIGKSMGVDHRPTLGLTSVSRLSF